ncbi:hypothetical protein [Wolbachia endosymbiont of Trichogramma kaykai]|uniref:hypothetical protein n=1 Tax=Wolbachia endosymbiont of Trichogramma kaykai TaxID=444066 RepID=UPI0038919E2E
MRKVSDQNKNDKKLSNNENTNLIKNAFENLQNSSMLEVTKSLDSESDDKDDDQNRTSDSEWEDSTPSTPQSDGKKEVKVLTVVMNLMIMKNLNLHLRYVLCKQKVSHWYLLRLLVYKRNLKLLLEYKQIMLIQ